MLLDKATGANAIIQEKYVTISVCKKNVEEARNYFARVGADLIAHFGRLGSKCVELEPDERLRIFHDFYRAGEETEFRFDIKETRRKGHDFKEDRRALRQSAVPAGVRFLYQGQYGCRNDRSQPQSDDVH